MLDTADLYYNHAAISAALRISLPALGRAREDIFLTTKLHPSDLGETRCRCCSAAQLTVLGHMLQVLQCSTAHCNTVPTAGTVVQHSSLYYNILCRYCSTAQLVLRQYPMHVL